MLLCYLFSLDIDIQLKDSPLSEDTLEEELDDFK